MVYQEKIEPPPAILKIDGKEQISGIGSYCWGGTWKALCADMIGIPTAQEPLLASSHFTAHLRLPLQEPLYELRLNVVQVKDEDELNFGAPGWRWWKEREEKLFTLPLEREQDIELSLEPGLYVLSVGAWWEKKGSASYGFLVEVQANGMGTLPATPVSQEQAKEIAKSEINEVKAQTEFVEWEELWTNPNAMVGMPLLVRTINEEPFYWKVPVVLNEKVIGFIDVKMDGKVPRYGGMGCLYSPYYNSHNVDNCSSTITISTAKEVKEIAKNMTDKYRGAVSEPIYVYDDMGCCSGEAWMLKIVGKDGKIISRVFVSGYYAYERK
ncbi:MAG: hypothetical protein WAW23_10190 [Candidatus Methanoperedens sp.]